MTDTMTLTKTAAALCGALLIFLLGGWAGELLYHSGGGHGKGDHHAQAYTIDTGEDDHGGDEAEEEVIDFAAIFAAADAAKGEKVFGKCRSCHKLEDGANGTGPHLYGVVDRAMANVDGFGYSSALSEKGEAWTAENLYAFLENPKGYVQGTSMAFAGLRKSEDRANLIAYLQTIGN